LGIGEAVELAGFHPNGGNIVWWAGRTPHAETFTDGRLGFHTDRVRLEDVLVAAAREAGTTVYDGSSARDAEECVDGWRIYCVASSGTPFELRAPWTLDATGRRGVIARREGRETDRTTTTTALVRVWRRTDGFGDVVLTSGCSSVPRSWAMASCEHATSPRVRSPSASVGPRRVRRELFVTPFGVRRPPSVSGRGPSGVRARHW
jgi:hypothetical protein